MLKSVCLHINNLCNLNCSHCWSESGPYGKNKLEAVDVIAFAKAVVSLGVERISLSGGEPLLHPDILEIVRTIVDSKTKIVLTTNGTSTKNVSEFLENLTELQKSLIEFRVSVDGPKAICESFRGEGVFDKTTTTIKYIKENVGNVKVNCVVGGLLDSREWANFFEHLHVLNIDELALMSLSPRGRGDEIGVCKEIIWSNTYKLLQIATEMNLGFKVLNWDYLSLDNAYVLVEHHGEILLPGINEKDDIVIGHIKNLDIFDLKRQIIMKRKTYE